MGLIIEQDLLIKIWRNGTRETLVEITHIPTGKTARSMSEPSMLQNKTKAMEELRLAVAEHVVRTTEQMYDDQAEAIQVVMTEYERRGEEIKELRWMREGLER